MLLGTVTQNTTATFRVNFCPEILLIVSAGVPVRVQVRALGEGVILDTDATGLALLKQVRKNKDVTNYYGLTLSDGLLKNKNIEIDVSAHASNAATVYGYSTGREGTGYIMTERATVLANTSQEFRQFFGLGLSAINANDQITIHYKSGVSQVFSNGDEIKNLSADTGADVIWIDNLDGEIDRLTVIPTSNITVYKTSYKE